MSVSGISSSSFFQPNVVQNKQNSFQQIQTEFQQLGQDLQSGNLTQSQQDFSALSQSLPSSASSGPLSSDLSTLGKALQSGSLATAQKAYTSLEQDVQVAYGASGIHHRQRNSQDSQSSTLGQQGNPITQLFGQLGQALQTGSLTAAQMAYSTMAQDLSLTAGGLSSSSAGALMGSAGLSLIG